MLLRIHHDCIFGLIFDSSFYMLRRVKPQACAVSAAAVALKQSPNDRVKASLEVVKAVKHAGASDSLAQKLADAYVKQEPSTPVFIASKSFDGKMEGYVFKTGKRGVGYYLDQGLEEEGPAELELGRDDPMFHDMDDEVAVPQSSFLCPVARIPNSPKSDKNVILFQSRPNQNFHSQIQNPVRHCSSCLFFTHV